MVVYVAFLRGINVGGRNLIKMKEVCHQFESIELEKITSYRASGNILFTTELEQATVVERIKETLFDLVGRNVEVFLRTSTQIEEIMSFNPFRERELSSAKLYVTFIPTKTQIDLALPLQSPQKDVELFLAANSNLFSQAYPRKGRYGTPNKFIEKELQVPATTRNWNTIKVISEILNRDY